MPPTGTIILAGIGVVVLGLLLLRIGRAFGWLLLVLGLVALLGFLAVSLLHQSQATAAASTATVVAATGQAANSIAVTVLAVLLVVAILAGGGFIAYLYLRLRQAERRQGQWLPGPNARWGRTDGGVPPSVPVPWWMYYLPPPPWWGYPQPPTPQMTHSAMALDEDDGDGDMDLDALPWGEDWGW